MLSVNASSILQSMISHTIVSVKQAAYQNSSSEIEERQEIKAFKLLKEIALGLDTALADLQLSYMTNGQWP